MRTSWLAFLVLLLNACAAPDSLNNPESAHFHILSESQVRTGMQQMANRIHSIANTSLNEEISLEQRRDRILPMLDDIESIAGELDGDQAITNYSVINRYMGSFLFDVSVARKFVQRNPPNLLPAQRLIKSCLSCHDSI